MKKSTSIHITFVLMAACITMSLSACSKNQSNENMPQLGKAPISQIIDSMSLASFNPSKEAWIAEAGKYEVKIGASATDIRQKALFTLSKNLTVEKVHKALMPKVKINAFSDMGRTR